jgi:hypothetical protein
MNKLAAICLALVLGMAPYPLAAASFDGSVPLICALIEVFDCAVGADCQRGTPESVNLPQFVKLDFSGKTLSTTEDAQGKKVTPIKHVEQFGNNLMLQGGEEGRGWSLILAKEGGKMSATVADDGVGFVIFGACTPF